MIIKFPENIYFYHEQYSNQRVLSEVANFDFDNLNAYEKEVHVWFSTFDAYDFDFNVPNYKDGFITCRHRPRDLNHDTEWSFYYAKSLKDDDTMYNYYHDNRIKYENHARNYLAFNYSPLNAINNSLVIIKSVRDILQRNNVQKFTFYKPLKNAWWKEWGDDWFDTGHHTESLVKNHKLSYILKDEYWQNEFKARGLFRYHGGIK